jgi:hypothetical protein
MATVNITVENDADFYRVFQYMTAVGTPIDMTGASLEMMLRRHAEDVEAELRLGTDTGEIILLNPAGGLFSVRILQDTLARLGLGSHDQSMIMTLNGMKIKIWFGTLINNAGPTR